MESRRHPTPQSSLDPALSFLRHLWRLNHALEATSSRMARTLGVTAQQRLFLRCVGQQPGISPSDLAERLHLDPGTISSALGRLEAKGLLARARDPNDQRKVTLLLTPAGRRLNRPTRGTVESAVNELLRSSAPADLAAARRILDALSRLLEADG